MEFEQDTHTAIWGEEDWLVSAHPSAPSRIRGEARTLREVCPEFPLLVKHIRAERRLSVQVHLNDRTAKIVGGEPKMEMWYILKAGPIYAGFYPWVKAEDVACAVADGSFEELMVRINAREGSCYLIPGGLVHAIGEGVGIFEVQQSSDTTYRLYDWGRLGPDGNPRPLHVREALAVMDLSLPPPEPMAEVHCPFFDFRVAGDDGADWLGAKGDAWRVVHTPSTGVTQLLRPGEMCDVAADSLLVRTA